MGVRAGPGGGEELHRQDELLAWHRLELWPRRPTHHDNVPHPEHPRDPQRHRQHLLPHSVRASATGFNPLPSRQLPRPHSLSPPPPPTRTARPPPRPPHPPLSTHPPGKVPSSTSSHSSSRRDSR